MHRVMLWNLWAVTGDSVSGVKGLKDSGSGTGATLALRSRLLVLLTSLRDELTLA